MAAKPAPKKPMKKGAPGFGDMPFPPKKGKKKPPPKR